MSLAFCEPKFDAGDAKAEFFWFWVACAVEVVEICFEFSALEGAFGFCVCICGLVGCSIVGDGAVEEF